MARVKGYCLYRVRYSQFVSEDSNMTWNPNHGDGLCVEFEGTYLVLCFPGYTIWLKEVLDTG